MECEMWDVKEPTITCFHRGKPNELSTIKFRDRTNSECTIFFWKRDEIFNFIERLQEQWLQVFESET
uniref:Uncharacterized protein n=1 Tax=viral metagenome TaxID=1070528 RepID=A0A6H1ZM51_9ZZZZ